jgi:hypothetical protein
MSDISIRDVRHLDRRGFPDHRNSPATAARPGQALEKACARMEGMSTDPLDTSLPDHLEVLVASGEVRAGDDSRFLPEPVRLAEGEETAADYVSEGRR